MKTSWKSLVLNWVGMGALLALLAGPGIAFGQAAAPAPAAAPAAPAADAPPQILGMDFTGFLDAGYTSFSTGKGTFTNRGHARTFDWENGVASIQSIDLQLTKTPETGFGGVFNVTLGKDADTIHSQGLVDKDKGPYFSDVAANGDTPAQSYWDLTQLYGFYGMGKVSLIFGKFATHAGQEVIKSRDDTNFSRAILFGFAIPFTHTGLRATYKPTDTLAILVGANEGWDTVTSKNGGVTGELGWEWSPSKTFSFFGTYLSGQETVATYPSDNAAFVPSNGCAGAPFKSDGTGCGSNNLADTDKGTRTLLDLILTYNATDALTFVLNYDSGSQEKAPDIASATSGLTTATWSGSAIYANYGINDNWRVSGRGETFNDKGGYRIGVLEKDPSTITGNKTTGPTWNEGTLTVAYMGIKKVELRGEVRSDSSDQKIFSNKAGDDAISTMTSLALEALYKF